MSDKALWGRIQNNDNDALKEIFNLYYKLLCTYMMQFTHNIDDAEDLAQDAFIKLWAKRENITIKTSLKSYLFRLAYNSYIDRYKQQKKEDQLLVELKYEGINSIIKEDTSIKDQKIKQVKKLIEHLPEKCKEILLLSKEKGLKNKEIAKTLGISVKTVESQIRIAFQKIRNGYKVPVIIAFFLLELIS